MSEDNPIPVSPEEIKLPLDAYFLRITDAEKKLSSKKQPMVVTTVEIINHPGINLRGQVIDINGLEIIQYTSLSEKALFAINGIHKAVGMPQIKVEDLAGYEPAMLKGLEFAAVCKSESRQMLNEETKQPVLNPYTGEPVVIYNRKISMLIDKPAQ